VSSGSTPCPETPPVEQPPPDAKTATFSDRWWTDGTIWAALGRAHDGRWRAGEPLKVGWWRGIGGRLTITGRPLNGSSATLAARVSDAYGTSGFQPSAITLPRPGCWRIEARLGSHVFTFVVDVHPPSRRDPKGGTGDG
jgi:hypothetical protein